MTKPILTAITGLALLLTGCSGGEKASGDYGIGVAYNPRDEAGIVLAISYGAQIAVNFLNAERAENQPKFKVILAPPDVGNAIGIAQVLRDDPKVLGIVGPRTSGEAFAAMGVYSDAERAGRNAVVALSPSATSPGLSGYNPWLFRMAPSDNQNARTVARFIVDSTPFRRVSILRDTAPFGRDFTKVFIDEFTSLGGTVVSRTAFVTDNTEAQVWPVYAAYLKTMNPDIIMIPGPHLEAVALLRALKAIGQEFPVIGGDDMSGMETHAAEFPETRYVSFFEADQATTPHAKAFVEAYSKAFKLRPDSRAAASFDAAMLLGKAILAVGPDRIKIRDYIESVGKERPALDGVGGPIAFDARHDVQKPAIIKKVGQ